MLVEDIRKWLNEEAEEEYRDFSHSLSPTLDKKTFLGVRMPKIRAYYKKNMGNDFTAFLEDLPHKYHEENVLHAVIISQERDFKTALYLTEEFLPYITGWAVCDALVPKVFEKDRETLLDRIKVWIASKKEFVVRFAIKMLMTYYLGDYYKDEYGDLVAGINLDKYYVVMMQAWYFAEAIVQNYDKAILYIEENRLSKDVHNKAIQKAVESLRVPDDTKDYLRSLRRK